MADLKVNPKFEEWLMAKLDSLEVDSETYGSYIVGILSEGEEEDCILKETLESIIEKDVDKVCEEILQQWKTINSKVEDILELKDQTYEQDSAILSDLITSHLNLAQKQAAKKDAETGSTLSEERKSVKESVMALYGTMQSAESYGDEGEDNEKGNEEEVLFSNTNVQSVHNAEKLERSKRKEESMKKKEKDKMDLEMQKLKKIERKEKEKKRTQKRERGGK